MLSGGFDTRVIFFLIFLTGGSSGATSFLLINLFINAFTYIVMVTACEEAILWVTSGKEKKKKGGGRALQQWKRKFTVSFPPFMVYVKMNQQ